MIRRYILSEQHPREQGLKLDTKRAAVNTYTLLSEQHPREQGLKRAGGIWTGDPIGFQSNIQENKD